MNTDKSHIQSVHPAGEWTDFKFSFPAVLICVHPWLNCGFQVEFGFDLQLVPEKLGEGETFAWLAWFAVQDHTSSGLRPR